jgi:hypothetical protein
MPSSGVLRRVALVRTDFSQKYIATIIRVTRVGEQGTTFAVTRNGNTLQRSVVLLIRHNISSQRGLVASYYEHCS